MKPGVLQSIRLQRTGQDLAAEPGGSEVKMSACNAGDRVRSLGQEHPLEKEMATHSSILAWKILWTEESGGLHRVTKSPTRLST